MSDPLKGKRIFGIDLGTTNSAIALRRPGEPAPVVLPCDGEELLPSLVGWDDERKVWLVGRQTEPLRRRNASRVAYSVKRFIGRSFSDPAVLGGKDVGYRLAGSGPDILRGVRIDLGEGAGQPSAVDLSARILARLREEAARVLGLPLNEVAHAVVTVPAYFNNNQREATRLAGAEAGWQVADLLEEPTAAALAHDESLVGPEERRLLVFDLGGGTFDVSLLEARRDEFGLVYRILAVDGDTRLGGDDVDLALAARLAERLGGPPDPGDDRGRWDRLRRAAERAKVALSVSEEAEVEFDGRPIRVSRAELEECSSKLRQRACSIARRAVQDVAALAWSDVDEVLLVGGQTLMPVLQQEVARVTGRPVRVLPRPQLSVALGAATYASYLALGRECRHQNALVNVLALDLGIRLEEDEFKVLVPAGKTLPHRSEPFRVTTTRDYQSAIHVEVWQGPRGVCRVGGECVLLGELDVQAPPAPAGRPCFAIRFEVRDDSTLRLEVHDPDSGDAPRRVDLAGARVALAREPGK